MPRLRTPGAGWQTEVLHSHLRKVTAVWVREEDREHVQWPLNPREG